MRFITVIKQYRLLFLVSFLAILILLLMGGIVYLNSYNHSSSSSTSSPSATNPVLSNFGLTGYAQLKSDVEKLFSTDQTVAQNPDYTKFVTKLITVEDKTVSAQNKYKTLIMADQYLDIAYSQTNDHALYALQNEVNSFGKTNFPTFYKQYDFSGTGCLDKTCAKNSQPAEVLAIVTEINTSSIPAVVKTSFVRNLLNPGYMNDNRAKTEDYLIVASVLNSSGTLKGVGLNTKLSQELLNYIKSAYPTEYATLNPTRK
jgi:hypothetical protein